MTKKYMGVPRADIPWFPRIDAEKCTLCGKCAEFCPNDVFEAGAVCMLIKNPINCVVGCDKCAAECPVGAISFATKEELLAWVREARAKTEKKEEGQ